MFSSSLYLFSIGHIPVLSLLIINGTLSLYSYLMLCSSNTGIAYSLIISAYISFTLATVSRLAASLPITLSAIVAPSRALSSFF